MKLIIEIDKKTYNRLVIAERKLECLIACGVDNWEGFDDAMEMFYGSDDEEE